VRVRLEGLPQISDVVETNFCDIGFAHDTDAKTLTVVSAIDNLTKGASGQAVQNFNVMHHFPETLGILNPEESQT
jgi:N-acetyl-gamma-glutamyl-phosphate reductase